MIIIHIVAKYWNREISMSFLIKFMKDGPLDYFCLFPLNKEIINSWCQQEVQREDKHLKLLSS